MTDEQIPNIAKGVYEEVMKAKGMPNTWDESQLLRDAWVAEVRAWAGLDDEEKANEAARKYIVSQIVEFVLR